MARGHHGSYDLVVLGGRRRRVRACALRAAELGQRVALIEKHRVGGPACISGCIPTKALLHAAEIADHTRDGASVGVRSGVPSRASTCPACSPIRMAWWTRLWKGLQSTIASK